MGDWLGKCKNCGDPLPHYKGKTGPKREYCEKVTCNAQYRGVSIVKKSYLFTKVTRGWSRYGGRNKTIPSKRTEDWFCQSCNRVQPKEFPGYPMAIDDMLREFINICAECKRFSSDNRIFDHIKLIKRVRNL